MIAPRKKKSAAILTFCGAFVHEHKKARAQILNFEHGLFA